jgi:fatty acid desaturase
MGGMTPEQERAPEPRASSGAGLLAVPIALMILALICAAGSLIFVVFGGWPGALLLLFAAILGLVAKRQLRKAGEANS